MNNIIWNNLTSIVILAVLLLAIVISIILVAMSAKIRRKNNVYVKLDDLYSKIKEDIKFSVTPKFMEVSAGVSDLADLAVEVWRMEQRIAKSAANLPENQLKGLEHSVQRLKRYLEKYDIEIIDYNNVKYNDGLNLDVLSVEKDPALAGPMVKETVEPTIMCKGQVIRRAKIILISNN